MGILNKADWSGEIRRDHTHFTPEPERGSGMSGEKFEELLEALDEPRHLIASFRTGMIWDGMCEAYYGSHFTQIEDDGNTFVTFHGEDGPYSKPRSNPKLTLEQAKAFWVQFR